MHVEDHPYRLRRVRGRDSGRLRRGHRDAVGPRARGRPKRTTSTRRLKKGDLKFTAERLQAEGFVGAGPHPRMGRREDAAQAATARAGSSSSIATTGRATSTSRTFAPKSVKSDGDFEDILAADTPAIWISKGPTKGGEASKMLAEIVEKAAKLKAGRGQKEVKKKTVGRFEKVRVGGSRLAGAIPAIASTTRSTARTASRRRSWRAMSPVQNSPPTSSQCGGSTPASSGFLFSRA